MRTSPRGSRVRVTRAVCPLTLSVAMALSVPGLAEAEPAAPANGLAALVADVAEANQRLQDIGAAVQTEQESVNKAAAPLRAVAIANALIDTASESR